MIVVDLRHSALFRGTILIGMFFLAGPLLLAQDRVDLEGHVRTDQGQTIRSSVSVILETKEDREVGRQFADSEGTFQFPSLERMVYRLMVSAKGFDSYQGTVDLTFTGNPVVVNVSLTPARRTGISPSSQQSRSDQAAPGSARKANDKGTRALKEKTLAKARGYFEQAIQIDPCYARAICNLALVRFQEHDSAGGETLLRKAIKCDSDFLNSYIELGQFLNSDGKFAESKSVLQQGIRRRPSAWQFYYQLGLDDYGEQDYTRAVADFHKAQSFNSSPPSELYVKLADCYVKLREYPKAYAAMQSYLLTDPNGRYASNARRITEQMRAAGVVGSSPPQPGASAKRNP